jgi:hypothetical protein
MPEKRTDVETASIAVPGFGDVTMTLYEASWENDPDAGITYRLDVQVPDRGGTDMIVGYKVEPDHRAMAEKRRAKLPPPFEPTADMPRERVMQCGACGELATEPGEEPLYECFRCGQAQVGERRCEQCNIFMARVADNHCPHCEAAWEPHDALAVRDPDGGLHEVEA